MSDHSSSPSLLTQLSNKARRWHKTSGITQAAMAAALGLASSNYNSFLSGTKGIGAEATCKLLEILSLPASKVTARFSKPPVTSRIIELQQHGKKLRFDDNGIVNTGSASNGAADASTIDQIIGALLKLDPVTRQSTVDAIAKAFPNKTGITSPTAQRF